MNKTLDKHPSEQRRHQSSELLRRNAVNVGEVVVKVPASQLQEVTEHVNAVLIGLIVEEVLIVALKLLLYELESSGIHFVASHLAHHSINQLLQPLRVAMECQTNAVGNCCHTVVKSGNLSIVCKLVQGVAEAKCVQRHEDVISSRRVCIGDVHLKYCNTLGPLKFVVVLVVQPPLVILINYLRHLTVVVGNFVKIDPSTGWNELVRGWNVQVFMYLTVLPASYGLFRDVLAAKLRTVPIFLLVRHIGKPLRHVVHPYPLRRELLQHSVHGVLVEIVETQISRQVVLWGIVVHLRRHEGGKPQRVLLLAIQKCHLRDALALVENEVLDARLLDELEVREHELYYVFSVQISLCRQLDVHFKGSKRVRTLSRSSRESLRPVLLFEEREKASWTLVADEVGDVLIRLAFVQRAERIQSPEQN
mmetsp:Transcript_338/g.1136  ORF Transcript_338/g.1136 Transcript_338/m.1136 type:complete len:420 (+) Transcript_338:996-2255(+)